MTDYAYTYVVETDDHVYVRAEPTMDAAEVAELVTGIRLQAAEPIKGQSYGGSRPGDDWYPVLWEDRPGFLAAGFAHVSP
jgi:hypothetical protein